MDADHRILACVDQSPFADVVADHAAWAARRLSAPLEFLHVIDKHPEVARSGNRSGAIGIDAQESLLQELVTEDESFSRAAREQGRRFLDRLRERAVAAGIEAPDVRLRHGHLEDTLVEFEAAARLIVLGRRGEAAAVTQRDLGRNVERVVRALHRPILAVTDAFTEPRRILIAFGGDALSRRGVQLVAEGDLFRGLPVHVLMSGRERRDSRRQLAWAQRTLRDAGFDVSAELVPGDAETIIARCVLDQGIDLIVMGAYSHSPLRSLLLGSRTSDLLRSARIPALLLR